MTETTKEITPGSEVTLHFSLSTPEGLNAVSTFEEEPAQIVLGDGSLTEGLVSEDILITDEKVGPDQLKTLCERWFGDMVKIVVDVEKNIIGLGGELHADAEAMLLEKGSRQEDVWGANLYPWHDPEYRIEYTALINIRPSQENPSMTILDNEVRKKVGHIIETLVLNPNEKWI